MGCWGGVSCHAPQKVEEGLIVLRQYRIDHGPPPTVQLVRTPPSPSHAVHFVNRKVHQIAWGFVTSGGISQKRRGLRKHRSNYVLPMV